MKYDSPTFRALVILVSLITGTIVGAGVGWLFGNDFKSGLMSSFVITAVGLFLLINRFKWK